MKPSIIYFEMCSFFFLPFIRYFIFLVRHNFSLSAQERIATNVRCPIYLFFHRVSFFIWLLLMVRHVVWTDSRFITIIFFHVCNRLNSINRAVFSTECSPYGRLFVVLLCAFVEYALHLYSNHNLCKNIKCIARKKNIIYNLVNVNNATFDEEKDARIFIYK